MKRFFIALAAICALVGSSAFAAQCTGGDKGRKTGRTTAGVANHRSEPPDPLVAHKSPGRNKRSRRRRHRAGARNSNAAKPDAITIKQK